MLAVRIPAAGVNVDWSDERVQRTAFELLMEQDDAMDGKPRRRVLDSG